MKLPLLGRAALALGVASANIAAGSPAWAWDPATTQAGLTEKALLASNFHKVLAERLGRPLGAFEPLALHSRLLPSDLRQSLWARLALLDPAGGYRPDADGVNSAIGWVTAGSVLAETPPERGRNHFFDPITGRGLDDADGLAGTAHAARLTIDSGGSLRGLATGTTFDLTGQPSLRWVEAADNDLGLPVFTKSLEQAVAAAESAPREAALTRALLALGGVLAVLQDTGEPAHVRNDFRASYLERQGPSGWDRGSRFERFVADRYGRTGVPAPGKAIERPSWRSFFTDQDGQGLAERTQRRFFSDGTLPEEIPVEPATTPRDVVEIARASLAFALPTVGRLELRGPSQPRYMMLEGRKSLGYVREPEGVRFFLDDAIYAESAKALLPEVGSYAAGLVNHLFRASVAFSFEGETATLKVSGLGGGKAKGILSVFAEDAAGRRAPIAAAGGERSLADDEIVAVNLPAGTKRVAVTFRGDDGAGSLLVVGEAPVSRR